MAKFSIRSALSRKQSVPDTTNFESGRAFTQTAKLELASVLVTTFLEDEFYRTEKDTVKRIRELMGKVEPKLSAKAALFARNTYGMRSVSHLVAGELAKGVKGQPWTKRFYAQVARRPDDVLETLGYYPCEHHPVRSRKAGLDRWRRSPASGGIRGLPEALRSRATRVQLRSRGRGSTARSSSRRSASSASPVGASACSRSFPQGGIDRDPDALVSRSRGIEAVSLD